MKAGGRNRPARKGEINCTVRMVKVNAPVIRMAHRRGVISSRGGHMKLVPTAYKMNRVIDITVVSFMPQLPPISYGLSDPFGSE